MTTPADELRAAAARARAIAPFGDIRGPLAIWEPLARLLDSTAASLTASTHPGWQDCVAPEALAVARALNGGQQ